MQLDIPNFGKYEIQNLIFDYNGTIAVDGIPLDIYETLIGLSENFSVFILTGDTYGDVEKQLLHTPLRLHITKNKYEKEVFINHLDPLTCIAVGNGNIDALMLHAAAIGIAVVGPEGCSYKALKNADIIVNSIDDAISLIVNPTRMVAGLKE